MNMVFLPKTGITMLDPYGSGISVDVKHKLEKSVNKNNVQIKVFFDVEKEEKHN